MYWPSATLGTPIGAPKQQYLPLKRARFPWPLSKSVRTSNTLSKLPNEAFFCLNPPHPWPGATYRPSGTLGTPIRAPKQQYLPLKRARFPEPLFKRVRISNTLSKLPNEAFFCLNPPHPWPGAMYWPAGTLGAPIRPPKPQYLPPKQACFP